VTKKPDLASLAKTAGSTRTRTEPEIPAEAPTEEKPAMRPSSRSGAKPITVHLAKEVRDQLKILSVQNDTTMQNLICEAFNDLFAKYGKPEIART
jgi:hypothetical protein